MNKKETFVSQLKRPVVYLPYLLAPLSIATIYVYYLYHPLPGPRQPVPGLAGLEEIGVFLIGSAAAIYWIKTVWTRNLTYVLMFALVTCLFLRELHWEPAREGNISIKDAIYPLLGLCAIWFVAWRKLIDGPIRNFRHTVFFIPALVTYVLAQAVEKRMFRFMPFEENLHTCFEEAVEDCGHLLVLMASVWGSWERKKITVKPDRLDKPATNPGSAENAG